MRELTATTPAQPQSAAADTLYDANAMGSGNDIGASARSKPGELWAAKFPNRLPDRRRQRGEGRRRERPISQGARANRRLCRLTKPR